MSNKNGYDVAVPPNPTPDMDFACGYVYQTHQEATHIWTVAEWDRARATSRWLLPIATCWTPFTDPVVDARNAVLAWERVIGALPGTANCVLDGTAFALDMEISVAESPGASAYAQGWRDAMRSLNHYDVVYSSASAIPNLGNGPIWTFASTAMLGQRGIVAVQTGQTVVNGTTVDTDVALDTLPFFDIHPQPKGRKMFHLFQITDAPTPGQRAAVWATDGVTRSWVQNPQSRDVLILFAELQGLPTDIAELNQQQANGILVVGPTPT